jgi:amino acid permease
MLSPEDLVLVFLIGIRWNLRVTLIYISLITKDFEHFFRCFSAIQDLSVVKSWFSSIPHFLIGLFVCLFGWLVGFW